MGIVPQALRRACKRWILHPQRVLLNRSNPGPPSQGDLCTRCRERVTCWPSTVSLGTRLETRGIRTIVKGISLADDSARHGIRLDAKGSIAAQGKRGLAQQISATLEKKNRSSQGRKRNTVHKALLPGEREHILLPASGANGNERICADRGQDSDPVLRAPPPRPAKAYQCTHQFHSVAISPLGKMHSPAHGTIEYVLRPLFTYPATTPSLLVEDTQSSARPY